MSRQLIGVDVGGTKISVASLQDGRLQGPHLVPTVTTGGDALLDQIVGVVEEFRGPQAAGVGIGVPSVVEFETGRVRSSVNIPLQDVPLRSVLGERLGLPVFVDNDATCAALAEASDGERITVRNLAMLTVGTGVGGGLVIGGRVYRGATGAAGEVGHMLIGADLERGAPARGRFPQDGSLEALAAGRALDALAEAASRDADSYLGRLASEGREVKGPDVVAAARDGDGAARELLRLVGERLGVGIANVVNLFEPDVVVVGGGAARAGELLLGPAREAASRFILPGLGEATEIRLARYGVEAGVRGAALLVGQELDEEEGTGAVAPAPRTREQAR